MNLLAAICNVLGLCTNSPLLFIAQGVSDLHTTKFITTSLLTFDVIHNHVDRAVCIS